MFSDFHRVELGLETWPENHNCNYTSFHDPRFDLAICLTNRLHMPRQNENSLNIHYGLSCKRPNSSLSAANLQILLKKYTSPAFPIFSNCLSWIETWKLPRNCSHIRSALPTPGTSHRTHAEKLQRKLSEKQRNKPLSLINIYSYSLCL